MNTGKHSDLLAADAADWIIALDDADRKTREAFVAWLRTSPEHIREFLGVWAVWDSLPNLTSQPSVDELVRVASERHNVVSLPAVAARDVGRAQAGGRIHRSWMPRAAAVMLLALGAFAALVLLLPGEGTGVFATEIGEQATVPLPDGSLASLNTSSKMRVGYTVEFRDIHLLGGEALFEVKRDATRPFRVITHKAVIVAVGTTFNVRADGDEVTVTVVEGIVEVASNAAGELAYFPPQYNEDPPSGAISAVRLGVGQQARVQARSAPAVLFEAAVGNAIAWREQRLVFDGSPLKEVINEFNRYNEPPVMIADRQLDALPISGVFHSNDRESFLQFLSQMQLAESQVGENGEIVLVAISDD